jgi:hypothetical protein
LFGLPVSFRTTEARNPNKRPALVTSFWTRRSPQKPSLHRKLGRRKNLASMSFGLILRTLPPPSTSNRYLLCFSLTQPYTLLSITGATRSCHPTLTPAKDPTHPASSSTVPQPPPPTGAAPLHQWGATSPSPAAAQAGRRHAPSPEPGVITRRRQSRAPPLLPSPNAAKARCRRWAPPLPHPPDKAEQARLSHQPPARLPTPYDLCFRLALFCVCSLHSSHSFCLRWIV